MYLSIIYFIYIFNKVCYYNLLFYFEGYRLLHLQSKSLISLSLYWFYYNLFGNLKLFINIIKKTDFYYTSLTTVLLTLLSSWWLLNNSELIVENRSEINL